MKRGIFVMILLLAAPMVKSQSWTLKDSGAGLIIVPDNDVKPLKIVRRNTLWDMKELYDKGAMDGKFNGNQLFAAWIQGPETKEYLNSKGISAWMYRYRITYPDGKMFESKSGEFLPSGYSYFGIVPNDYTDGIWKIEWFVVNRENLLGNHVATSIFQASWGKSDKSNSLIIKSSDYENDPP